MARNFREHQRCLVTSRRAPVGVRAAAGPGQVEYPASDSGVYWPGTGPPVMTTVCLAVGQCEPGHDGMYVRCKSPLRHERLLHGSLAKEHSATAVWVAGS